MGSERERGEGPEKSRVANSRLGKISTHLISSHLVSF